MAQGATPSILHYLRSLGAKDALKEVSDGELLEGKRRAVNLAQLGAGPLRKARVRARASNDWNGQTPDKAFAGGTWNAGDYAPQCLEADLGASTELASLLVQVMQLPNGENTHEVWVSNEPIGAERAKAKLVHTFRGNTESSQRLRFAFPKEAFARYVQVRTTQSPSWVAWGEVELRVGRARLGFVKEEP